jgi:phage terminase small subunit
MARNVRLERYITVNDAIMHKLNPMTPINSARRRNFRQITRDSNITANSRDANAAINKKTIECIANKDAKMAFTDFCARCKW